MKTFCLTTLVILFVGLSSCNLEPTPKNYTSQKLPVLLNQMDTAKVLFNKEEYGESFKLLTDYLKKHPEETKWANIYLGDCYDLQTDYEMAEKYYTQATWFDYSKADGLIDLGRIIFHKLIPREQGYKLLLEYWQRISESIPIIEAEARVCIIKDFSIERFLSIPEALGSNREGNFPNAARHLLEESKYIKPSQYIIEAKKAFEKGQLDTAIAYYRCSAYGYILSFEGFQMAWQLEMGEDPPFEERKIIRFDLDTHEELPQQQKQEKDNSSEKGKDTKKQSDEYSRYMADWSPICFNKIAECYIKKAEESEAELNSRIKGRLPILTGQDGEKEERYHKNIYERMTEEYNTAVYYYHWACWGYPELYELNLPRIKQLRQKIAEIEQLQHQNKPKSNDK